jgi:hypothetical protein
VLGRSVGGRFGCTLDVGSTWVKSGVWVHVAGLRVEMVARCCRVLAG